MAMKAIKVAEVFLIEEEDQIVGSEIGFTEAVTEAQGAVTTMNVLRKSMDDSGWVTRAIMNVAERGKQSDVTPVSDEPDSTDGDTAKKKDAKNK